jgi:hypothetical protein
MSWLVVVAVALSLSMCLNIFMIWYMVKLKDEINKYKLSFSLIEETKEIEDNDKNRFSAPS